MLMLWDPRIHNGSLLPTGLSREVCSLPNTRQEIVLKNINGVLQPLACVMLCYQPILSVIIAWLVAGRVAITHGVGFTRPQQWTPVNENRRVFLLTNKALACVRVTVCCTCVYLSQFYRPTVAGTLECCLGKEKFPVIKLSSDLRYPGWCWGGVCPISTYTMWTKLGGKKNNDVMKLRLWNTDCQSVSTRELACERTRVVRKQLELISTGEEWDVTTVTGRHDWERSHQGHWPP